MSLFKNVRRFCTAAVCASGLMMVSLPALAEKKCELTIEGTDMMTYSSKELTVPAGCTNVTLTLKHVGKLPKSAMGHNWILTAAKDKDAVAAAGIAAGLAKDYTPEKDARIVAATKLVGGGESATTTFKRADLKAGESYVYFCTFPGHSALMSGSLKF